MSEVVKQKACSYGDLDIPSSCRFEAGHHGLHERRLKNPKKGEESMCQLSSSSDDVAVSGNNTAFVELCFEEGPCRLKEIFIPADVARYFSVWDVKVAKNSQFISSACVPASFFNRPRESLLFDNLPRGKLLTLTVTNLSPEKQVFRCWARGEAGENPPSGGRVIMGLGHMFVPAKAAAVFRVQPQVVFRPDTLVIPADTLEDMEVTDLRVYGTSVFGALRPVEEVVGEWSFQGPWMQIADWLTIEVKNRSDANKCFRGAVVGPVGR